jgi:hypothetical protein
MNSISKTLSDNKPHIVCKPLSEADTVGQFNKNEVYGHIDINASNDGANLFESNLTKERPMLWGLIIGLT